MVYFTNNESKESRRRRPEVAVRNFHSSVKASLFSNANAGNLLDLGAGRGADVSRYKRFQSVTAVDSDEEALEQLSIRASAAGVAVETIHADFTKPLNLSKRYNTISAMFCVHYAVQDDGTCEGLALNVQRYLMPGGSFIGICMDGDKVYKELSSGPRWFGNWAKLELQSSSAVSVQIASISNLPKQERLVRWQAFASAMWQAGLIVEYTSCLEPGGAIQDEGLRKFSQLQRFWVMRFQ